MIKKEQEKDVLNRAFEAIEKNENIPDELKRITNLRDISSSNQERPDFVLQDTNGRKIGIEHFKVDEYTQIHEEKYVSGSQRLESKKTKTLKDYKAKGEHEPDNKDLGNLDRTIGQIINNVKECSFTRFINSFEKTFKEHYSRITEYKKNIDINFAKVDMVFLIEYTYHSGNYLTSDGKDITYPIWDNWIKILEKAKTSKIKQFIILFTDGKHEKEDYVLTFKSKNIKSQLKEMGIEHYLFENMLNCSWNKYIDTICELNDQQLTLIYSQKPMTAREMREFKNKVLSFCRRVDKCPCAMLKREYKYYQYYKRKSNSVLI